jgi:hypothetical protein
VAAEAAGAAEETESEEELGPVQEVQEEEGEESAGENTEAVESDIELNDEFGEETLRAWLSNACAFHKNSAHGSMEGARPALR